MALPALPVDDLVRFTRRQLDEYFEKYAGFFEDSPPEYRYAIRVGGQTLFSSDTCELKLRMLKLVLTLKRRRARDKPPTLMRTAKEARNSRGEG